jgi:hypothetical protein
MVRFRVLLSFLAVISCASGLAAQTRTLQRHSGASVGDNLPDAPSAQKSAASGSPKASSSSTRISRSDKDVSQLANGNTARLILLSHISSKSPSGSSFLARVQTAAAVEGRPLVPEGSIIEGHLQTTPARRMMHAGALRMIFDRIKLPDGTIQEAGLELLAAESNSVRVDNEGTAHPAVSKKRLAFQLGGALAIAKLADDISEEALAAGVGSARYYGLGAAAAFLVIQKGREVKLREGDVVEVEFVRTALSPVQ